MVKYGNYFEILTTRILDEDTHTSRIQDWMVYKNDFDDYTNKNIGYLPYEKWHPSIYIDGGFMIAKRDVLKSVHGFNEALHWGEAEDVDLSARLYNAGYMTNIDIANTVYTQTHRHKGVKENYFIKQIPGIKKTAQDIVHKRRLKKQNEEFIRYMNNFSMDFNKGNTISE
jgi:GT2 family glycosyltransferase